VKKKALESHFWKQDKVSIASNAIAFQNKADISLVASFAKSSLSKLPFLTPKKQFNSLQVDLSSKLASNSKLTSIECKKHLKNNLYLCYGTEDHKLDSCPKKQIIVTSKGCSALATIDSLAAASKKLLEK